MIALTGLFAGGAAYAGCLWFIALRTARRRALELGRLPAWVVVLSGGTAVAAWLFFAPWIALAASATLIGALICALVDARTGFIFDALSLTMAAVACIIGMLDHRLADGALGVAAVGGGLAMLYFVTSRRGIGLGDVKLGSAIALGYGLEAALVAIGSAFILGALYAGVRLAQGHAKRSDALRFGPFIAGGAAVGLSASALGWPW